MINNVFTLMRIFEIDLLDECVEKLRSDTQIGMQYNREESIAHMQSSINAKFEGPSNEMMIKL